VQDCGSHGQYAPVPPSSSLSLLARSTCGSAAIVAARVQVENGCPTLLEGMTSSGVPVDPKFLDCFAAALGGVRFECAQGTTSSTFYFNPN
jgi:hypothetical protein